MDDFIFDANGLIRRRTLVESGVADDRQLRTAVSAGSLDRIYRGVYVPPSDRNDPEARDERYRTMVLASVSLGGPDKAVSHSSAAALHGIPLLAGDQSAVHFTANRPSGGRKKGRACVLHAATFEPDEVMEVGGVLVTTPARTAVDIARAGAFAQAVTAFDGALRLGVSPDELLEVVRRCSGRTGASTARRALAVADGRAASVGESWSRALMHGFGDIPIPDLQREYRTDDDEFVGEVDFDWSGRLVGEFDGRGKYGRDGTSAEAVWREKRREDALRDLGLIVIRWVWDDLRCPDRFHAHLVRGLIRAGLRN
ncbi:type IV toxin-antitoxin system AbiEi family antitoxin domain-containing protein [Williamsia sp.]|uniref:type IV toxin-antitoxin system AbiEi family antitoxin domain-containing protein n=1 Tax=Williamsia sp. TaxID=1872085 RepID=UPI001A20F210|nr:type IV toxin-antitoxin system AbiEi family antitoxin domain-containing protein [Williamsia sp.]MBJ7290400.1 hypothetical protein [Williamsia sp.]